MTVNRIIFSSRKKPKIKIDVFVSLPMEWLSYLFVVAMSLSSFDKKEPEGFVARMHVGKLSINYILCTSSITVQLCLVVWGKMDRYNIKSFTLISREFL